VFWIARTGAPGRDLPEKLGNWNPVHRPYLRWTASGLWDLMLEALAEGGGSDAVQMVDSTVIRAHHCAAGARGDSKPGFWLRPRWIFVQNPRPDQR
jgi:transposase